MRPASWRPLPDLVGWVAAAALVGALWLAAGELGGLVRQGHLPAVPTAALPKVLASVPWHLTSPADAWPPPARSSLPPPAGFYTLVALIALAATALAREAWRLGRWRPGPSRPQGARWARPSELGSLAVRRPPGDRLVLGWAGRRLLAAEAGQSVIVLGPTQSGKTTGFAIPAILGWEGPVLATSVKADLVAATATRRREAGLVWVYDPAGASGLDPASWSPLDSCGSWAGARRMAQALCSVARGSAPGLADAEFWYATAAKLLAPLLLAAASSGRTMAEVVAWVDTQETEEPAAVLARIGAEAALRAALASFGREPRQRSSVYTTAETVLEAFADPGPEDVGPRVDLERLLDGGRHTLYVCGPPREQQRLQPAFAGLVSAALAAAYRRAGQPGPRLLVVLDEAANIAPLADLDTVASTASGARVQLVSIWQDMAQIQARYGERAATVVNNHRGKVVLSGVSDPATLEQLSSLIGEAEQPVSSFTWDRAGSASTTRAPALRRLVPSSGLRQIRPGEGVLVYGHLPPVRLRLQSWR